MKALHIKLFLLAVIGAIALAMVLSNFTLAQPALVLQSVYVDGELPVTDPASPLWAQGRAVEVPLAGQGAVEPVKVQPSTPNVRVQALNNGTHIAFRVTWSDETVDNRTTKDQEFRDSAALLFASSTLPGICMGTRGQFVHILQWKADWQADIDEGFHDLEDAYPNFWVDYYPFAVGEPPYSLPEAWPEDARELLVGWSVGNPFSQPLKVTPVEDALAQGFGTIATQDQQDALGRGVWEGGRWQVVIARPLSTGDPSDQEMSRGGRYYLALAVWDGSSGDVGARKSVTSWVNLEIPAAAPVLEAWVWALAAIPPVGAALFLWHVFRRRRVE